MKIRKLITFVFLLPLLLNAQPDFRTGYIIFENGDTVHGKIDYQDDRLMSTVCSFKQMSSESIIDYSPYDIKEFRFENSKCYVSRTQESGEKVFLEYLIKGKLNVYYYRDEEMNDYYFIDKVGLPLQQLPYQEEIRFADDGTRFFFHSKNHIGLLNVYTQDIPAFRFKTEKIESPDHQNLIKFAKDYHDAVCKDEKCIIYEKYVPLIKASFEIFYGMTFYNKKITGTGFRTNDIGTNVYLWMPRASEKLYFKTGLTYCNVEKFETDYILNVPIQLYYQYSHYKLRPNFYLGSNNYFPKGAILNYFWTLSVGGGLNYKLSNIFSLGTNINSNLIPIPYKMLNNENSSLFSYSFSFGIRMDL